MSISVGLLMLTESAAVAALALPPCLPRAAAALVSGSVPSSISPVAILPTMTAAPITSGGASRLWPLGILGLDLADDISGLAKGNQYSLGEVDTFFVTFRDLVPRRAMPRTGMINESGFDGACYDDKAVFWHPGSPPALR